MKNKKRSVNKEEYLNIREEWNRRRIETKDEKNRRITEEMLEEITEKEHSIQRIKIEIENIEKKKMKKKNKSLEFIIFVIINNASCHYWFILSFSL